MIDEFVCTASRSLQHFGGFEKAKNRQTQKVGSRQSVSLVSRLFVQCQLETTQIKQFVFNNCNSFSVFKKLQLKFAFLHFVEKVLMVISGDLTRFRLQISMDSVEIVQNETKSDRAISFSWFRADMVEFCLDWRSGSNSEIKTSRDSTRISEDPTDDFDLKFGLQTGITQLVASQTEQKA
jgi:hypothetical protein